MSVRNEDSRFLLGTPTPDVRETEREASTSRRFRTLLHLLASDKSDAGDDDDDDRTSTRWRAFKERLGFTLIGCCGSPMRRRRESPSPPPENNNSDENGVVLINLQQGTQQEEEEAGVGMNLAEALAAEREFRLAETPERVSLMRLLEMAEREREEEEAEAEEEVDGMGRNERVCCVCMVRKKGAAIIPCGHTFCRICSKEVWVNRGSCPLCNRFILDVLNIF